MSQAAAAHFLGISARQVDRMTKGQTEVPVVYVLLLRSMIYHDEEPVVPQWIREDTDA